jgi:precorrin isomerase
MNGTIKETGFREDSGCYQQSFYPIMPSKEDIELSKKNAEKNKRYSAVCACCDVNFAIPTTIRHIINTGICPLCQIVLDGKMVYVDIDGQRKVAKSRCISRYPTIEEIKETWKGGALTSVESSVVMKAIREKT